ncbi:MAG: hypothetical protein AAF990_08470, partial [Bacteroidota bacterium]
LKAYISSIEPQLLKHINGKVGSFTRELKEHNFLNEAAFIHHICGEKYDKTYYDNLKHRALKILQALAIISIFRGSSEVKKNLDSCRKNFTLGQKFLGKGELNEGIRLIKQAHRTAVRNHFVHMASELSSVLFHHYITYGKNKRIASDYGRQLEAYSQSYIIEKKTELLFYTAISEQYRSNAAKILQDAIKSIENLQGNSLKYHTYLRVLNIIYGFSTADYKKVIRDCNDSISFFMDKAGVYDSYQQFFRSKLGIAYMATGHYPLALKFFNEAEKYTHTNSKNDYILRFYRTINAIHAGNYSEAYQRYRKNRNCRFSEIKLQFAIVEAYMCFLAHQGYLKIEGRFRIGKYLNETFAAQAEKQGNNIAVIIAELLVYLSRDKGKFIDRVEAINNYGYRHLRRQNTRRAKWFIKILCTLPRANFNPVALQRLAKKPIEMLENHPIRMGENFAIEIIPFNDLLQMVLKQMQRKTA